MCSPDTSLSNVANDVDDAEVNIKIINSICICTWNGRGLNRKWVGPDIILTLVLDDQKFLYLAFIIK